MTSSFQSSVFNSLNGTSNNHYRNKFSSESIYQVEITDFDGDIQTLEVSASSFSEAASIAESLYSGQVNMMNVYEFC